MAFSGRVTIFPCTIKYLLKTWLDVGPHLSGGIGHARAKRQKGKILLQNQAQLRQHHLLMMNSIHNELSIPSRKPSIHDFPVAASLDEAGRQILLHSFAIYKVSSVTRRKIQAAHRAALRFFHGTTSTSSDSRNGGGSPPNGGIVHEETVPQQHRQRRVVSGHLYGFNVPSNTKHLFRAYCHSDEQPWHPDGALRTASLSLVEDLHSILKDCCHHIIQLANHDQNRHSVSSSLRSRIEGVNDDDDEIPSFLSHRRKRGRIEDMPDTDGDGERLETQTGSPSLPSYNIPETAAEARQCPLDYFFYHNRDPSAENCSAHVDRGVLIVVCLTNVPGLEVCPRGQMDTVGTNHDCVWRPGTVLDTSDAAMNNDLHPFYDGKDFRHDANTITPAFVCPEVLVHNENLYSEVEDTSSSLVCIMAGDQLSSVLRNGQFRVHPTHRMACLHRVRHPLKRARLSISYELRL
jgi:hypothetical protein